MSKKEEKVDVGPKPLKPEIETLSGKIRAGLTANKADGVISETESSYYGNLPEGITKETDSTLETYRKNFVAASTHAVGLEAIDLMKSNKKLDTVTAELPMGEHDVVRHSVEREKTYISTLGGDKKPIVKPGVITTDVDIRGSHSGSGQLKIARGLVGAYAAEKLGK